MKRTVILPAILAASFILLSALPSRAASIKTAVFTFARENCGQNISAKAESGVRRGLGSVDRISLVDRDEVDKALQGKTCTTSGCAVAACREVKAERAVTGEVSGATKESARTMGDSGKEQYLIQVSQKNTYTITVALWDVRSGRKLGRFSKTANEDDINDAADYLAAKLAALYAVEDKKKTADKQAAPGTTKIRGVLGISPSCIIPIGDFTDMAGPGAGFYLYGGIMNALFDNSLIMLSSGFWYLSEQGDVKTMYTTQLSLVLGYNFNLPKNFTIAPLLGAGYHFHLAERDEMKLYADPFISIRCEAGYMVYPSLYVTVTPAYSLFFEENSLGMYMTVEAGIKYLF